MNFIPSGWLELQIPNQVGTSYLPLMILVVLVVLGPCPAAGRRDCHVHGAQCLRSLEKHGHLAAAREHEACSFSNTNPKGNGQEELRKVKTQLKPMRFSAT